MCDQCTHAPCYRCCTLATAEINIISISWWRWNNISGGYGREMGEIVCHGLPLGSYSLSFPEHRRTKPTLLTKGISALPWTLVRKTDHIVCDGNLHQNGSGARLKLKRKFSLSTDERSVCFLPFPPTVPKPHSANEKLQGVSPSVI